MISWQRKERHAPAESRGFLDALCSGQKKGLPQAVREIVAGV